MKKYIFAAVLALLVFLMLFIINWHKNQLTKEIKSVGTVSNEIKSPEGFENEVDTLDNIRKLYESFHESKYTSGLRRECGWSTGMPASLAIFLMAGAVSTWCLPTRCV